MIAVKGICVPLMAKIPEGHDGDGALLGVGIEETHFKDKPSILLHKTLLLK